MDWRYGLGLAVFAFLLGSIPTGYLVGRSRGIDIRKSGSGNIGATNVFRTLGKGPGIFVFVCDALKGLAAVLLSRALLGSAWLPDPAGFSPATAGITAGIAAILGHNFTPWLGFKGGKGIATSAGVLLGLMPMAMLGALAAWLILFRTTRYVSVASMAAAVSLPLTTGALVLFGGLDPALLWFSVAAAALAIWRHRSNIARLRAGTESRVETKPRTGRRRRRP
jgi:glycerol-3-phosphate acyltransferase PlsY